MASIGLVFIGEVFLLSSQFVSSVVNFADESVDLLPPQGKGAANLEHRQEDVLRRAMDLLDAFVHFLLEAVLGGIGFVVGGISALEVFVDPVGIVSAGSVSAPASASGSRRRGRPCTTVTI